MRTEIEQRVGFEAAHRLPRVPPEHKCFRMHGHSFRVTLRVAGPVDPKLGWVVDFEKIRQAWLPLHEQLDHCCLNDVPGLENPTSENIARWIAERFELDTANLTSITVHETCNSAATVYLDASSV